MRFSGFSFGIKILIALFLIALADILFFYKMPGSTIGLFALAWTGAVFAGTPAIRKRRDALIALACAAIMALVLIDDRNLLALALFWCALAAAVLLQRCRFQDALQLVQRLTVQGTASCFAPLRDISRVARLPRPHFRSSVLSLIGTLALPLIGAVIFITLFANANPLIARSLPDFAFPVLDERSVERFLFWIAGFALIWPSLRPSRRSAAPWLDDNKHPLNLPGVTVLSVTLSLALFNVIFAVENLLDIAFLWSGAPLPQGVTMAQYAHRGAYPLIVTALLAGLFVLVTANPQSELGQRRIIRRLVVFWILQNSVLVASSIIRTVDYIDAYMLTRLRIAALIWMVLVAAGLGLICWRFVTRRSLRWLINYTALVTILVLGVVSAVDLGAIAAEWNVRHAREAGGRGQPLDLGYLHRLGPSAMVALAGLEVRPLNPEFRGQVAGIREKLVQAAAAQQAEPYGWTWRNARRLEQVKTILDTKPHMLTGMACKPWLGQLAVRLNFPDCRTPSLTPAPAK